MTNHEKSPAETAGLSDRMGHAGKTGIVEVGFLDVRFLADGDDGIVTAP